MEIEKAELSLSEPISVLHQPENKILPAEGAKKRNTLILIAAVSCVVMPLLTWGTLTLLTMSPGISHALAVLIKPIKTFCFQNARALNFLSCLGYLWVVWIGLSSAIASRLAKLPPTHLVITPEGLIAFRTSENVVKDPSFKTVNKPLLEPDLASAIFYFNTVNVLARIRWSKLTRISLDAKESAGNAQTLCFHMKNKTIRLKLGDVLTQEVRTRLLLALNEWAPHVQVDQEVYDLLEPRAETSFTELWISALSAPPERSRIVALAEKTLLNNCRYEVIEQLSSGGQAVVYKAKDLQNEANILLAIKEYVFPIHVTRDAAKNAIVSLEREAQVLSKLDHPNIVKLKDFFIEDHRGYLGFELIDGVSLRKLVENEGCLSESRVRNILHEMIGILQYLHTQTPPLIHRDFTPDNLILSPSGQVKLIDFNVAQAATETVNAIVAGKRSYMPPEQFRGKAVPQSDIYALGACLYFLLIGEDPEPLSVSSPKNANSSIDEHLNEIITKCTQLESADRYQSVADIAIAVRY